MTRFHQLLAILTLSTMAGLAFAQQAGNRNLTPEQAASQAQSRHGGRVLNVRPMPKGDSGEPGYRVKLLDRGEVRTVTVPPRDKGKKDKKNKKGNKGKR